MKQHLGHQLMLAFEGTTAPDHVLARLAAGPVGGFTIFRRLNVANPAQVRELTEALQSAAAKSGQPPLLIAADQEGGQLNALGQGPTAFPGNMALGASGDPQLAGRVGHAIGRELAAMGVNVNYAPVCDVNTNPANPNVGVRAFGDDAHLVAAMAGRMIAGLQSAGVAATAKHFPGNGESSLDPHFGVPVLEHDRNRLDRVEFLPFRTAVEAGVRLVMSAHVGLPALTGRPDLPATLSRQIMHGLLREEMGFEGLLISDALDMHAITQGIGQIVDVIAALRAGVDLLLMSGDQAVQERIESGLDLALKRGLLFEEQVREASERIITLKRWLASHRQPDLSLVGGAEHQALAEEVARRSITLVRNDDGLLPLRLNNETKVAVLMPKPADLTPADTSSYVVPTLAAAAHAFHSRVEAFVFPQRPTPGEIAALRHQVNGHGLLIIGTISASLQPEQATLVHELLNTGIPTVTIALRTPYDLAVYPQARTHLCAYSIQPATMQALAEVLWGRLAPEGRLPVQLSPELPRGHGLSY